jgi:sarcosine oxidase subunit gamma
MAEREAARHMALTAAPGGAPSVLPPMSRLVYRGRISTIGRVAQAFGVEPPMEPCRAATAGERAALWLGPDEWLLLAPEGEASEISAAIAREVAPLTHSCVDVSHRQIGLGIEGGEATTLLAAGCPLDLDAGTFPVGMCARTLLAKCEIVLWRRAPLAFHVEVARSFARYAAAFLDQAGRDL